jgi:hypothetical protein
MKNILFVPFDSATLANFATTGSAPFFLVQKFPASLENL